MNERRKMADTLGSQRKGAKSKERWEQILKVATRLFREKGFSATSMQDVSDAVGVLKGSLYYYVRSKEELLVGILRDLHENGEEIIAQVDFETNRPLEALYDFLIQIILYSANNADRLAIFLRDFQFVPEGQQSEIISERDMYTQATERLIVRAVTMGHVSAKLHVRIAAHTVLRGASSMHEWYKSSGLLPIEQVAAQTAAILVGGLEGYSGNNFQSESARLRFSSGAVPVE